ncbi:MAG: hypothetical protein U0X20_23615 [Caldilineaceae bacterium]
MNRVEAFGIYQQDIGQFSADVIGLPLRAYQREWAQYVLDVVQQRRDETIVIEMPRQTGKNQTSAHLELAILAWAGYKDGGHIIKAAPTFPQVANSIDRANVMAERVREHAPWLKYTPRRGYMLYCRRAGISYLSAQPKSSVVGATASLLMEVDEAQDVLPAKYDKDFSPMRASTAAPVVAYGTTWTDDTLLEQFKQDVREGRSAGRLFKVHPDQVCEENEAFARHLAREVARKGREHPIIRTQYYLEPIKNKGRLLDQQQLRQMIGDHQRQERRSGQAMIVAGLDFAGADEEAAEAVSLSTGSKRDSVALTIGAVQWIKIVEGVRVPMVRVLARYEWVNVHPLSIHTTLYDILHQRWQVNRVHADATGIGTTGAAMLSKALDGGTGKRVIARTFDSAWNTQTELVSQYIEMINGSRLLDYAPAGFDPLQVAKAEAPDREDPARHIWWQRGHARLEAKASQSMRAYVPEGEGHDDLLISEMLMCDAAFQMIPVGEARQYDREAIL